MPDIKFVHVGIIRYLRNDLRDETKASVLVAERMQPTADPNSAQYIGSEFTNAYVYDGKINQMGTSTRRKFIQKCLLPKNRSYLEDSITARPIFFGNDKFARMLVESPECGVSFEHQRYDTDIFPLVALHFLSWRDAKKRINEYNLLTMHGFKNPAELQFEILLEMFEMTRKPTGNINAKPTYANPRIFAH